MSIKFRAWDKKAREKFSTPTEVYRHKPKGMLTNLYNKMKQRSVNKGYGELLFSLEEFRQWSLSSKDFEILFDVWVSENYSKEYKPTVDRIDANQGYVFGNMQWLPWKINFNKGINEVSEKKKKPVIMLKNGKKVGRFRSIQDAQYFLGMSSNGNISMVLRGKRKSVLGYSFEYEDKHLLK